MLRWSVARARLLGGAGTIAVAAVASDASADPIPYASAFWPAADAACAQNIASIPADTLDRAHPGAAAAREELVAACATRSSPRFAAKREAERIALLNAILSSGGLGIVPPLVVAPAPTEAMLESWVETKTRATDEPLGPAARTLLGAVLRRVCIDPAVPRTLPLVCQLAANETAPTLSRVRGVLLRDLFALAQTLLRETRTRIAQIEGAEIALALIGEVLRSPDLRLWVDDLPGLAVSASKCDAPECAPLARAIRIGADILVRIERDGPRLERSPDHYVHIVEDVLREQLGDPQLVLDAAKTAATQQLVEVLRRIEVLAANPALPPAPPLPSLALPGIQELPSLALAADPMKLDVRQRQTVLAGLAIDAVRIAWTLATPSSVSPPPFPLSGEAVIEIPHTFDGALDGDVRGLAALARPSLDQLGTVAVIPPEIPKAVTVIAALASARTDAELKRIARDYVITLPAWTEPFILDINASYPHLDSDDFRINGDLAIGYNGKRWGVLGRGRAFTYDVAQGATRTQTDSFAGHVEGWWNAYAGAELAIDLRAHIGGAYYDTQALGGAATPFADETSWMERGSALAGARWTPSAVAGIALQVGGGVQNEVYDAVTVTARNTAARAGGSVTTRQASPFTGRFEAHARGQWSVWPSYLTLRARIDFEHLEITRSATTIVSGTGAAQVNATDTTAGQTELFARALLDFDVLRFFDFLPSLHGGVNYVARSGPHDTVPVFGIGFRREAL